MENAFRHTFGQALITRIHGEDIAIEAGFAHEGRPDIDVSVREFVNRVNPDRALSEADTVADLLNNQIGRRIGERDPRASRLELAEQVLREFYESGLYVAEFVDLGVVRIRRTRLTSEEYRRALSEVRATEARLREEEIARLREDARDLVANPRD